MHYSRERVQFKYGTSSTCTGAVGWLAMTSTYGISLPLSTSSSLSFGVQGKSKLRIFQKWIGNNTMRIM